MSVLFALWMSLASAQDCERAATSVELLETLGQADSAFVELDLDGFHAAAGMAAKQLECLEEPLVPADAAAVHRFQALVAFVEQRDEDVRRAYAAAAGLQPDRALSLRVAPDGHPLRGLYDEGAAMEPGRVLRVGTEGLLVDGTRAEQFVTGKPAVLQLTERSGAVEHTAWVSDTIEEALPEWVSIAQPKPDRPPRKKLKLGKPFAIAGGVSALAAGSLYVTSWATRAKYLNLETPMENLDGLRKTNHGTLVGAGVASGLAIGLGAAVLVVEW